MEDLAIKKIRGLLELASNPASTAEETATAAALADKLIAKYRISDEQLFSTSSEVAIYAEDDQVIYQSSRVTQWKAHLIGVLANHYGCAHFLRLTFLIKENKKRKNTSYILFGQKKDVEIVRYMFTWLSSTIELLTKTNGYGQGHVYCHSYSYGIVDGISKQLSKSRLEMKTQVADDASTSLVLVKLENRLQEAQQALNKAISLSKCSSQKSQARIDYDAYQSGKEAGSSLHLGKSLNA